MTPPAARAILEPLSVDDLWDLFMSLVNRALDMELVLDLREFSRGKLVDLIWLISISGPPVRIGGDLGRRRLPDAEALEKLARLAALYGGGAK